MLEQNDETLVDPVRLAAVKEAVRLLPGTALSLDGLARLAAHLLEAPMAVISAVDDVREQWIGAFGLPPGLSEHDGCRLDESVGAQVVRAGRVIRAEDLLPDADLTLSGHPLISTGIYAFVGVPVRDDAGRPVGALTVFDVRPRQWQDRDALALMDVTDLLTASVRDGVDGRTPAIGAAPPEDAGALDPAGTEALVAAALGRAERFEACHREVRRALRSAGTIDDAAPAALAAVTGALDWQCAELFLIDEPTGELRSAGHHDRSGVDEEGFFGHSPVKGRGITGRVWQTGEPLWVADIGSAGPDGGYEQERAGLCMRHGIRTVLAVPVRDGDTLLGVLTCYAGNTEVHENLLTVVLGGVAGQIGVYVALHRAEELARRLTRSQDDFLDLVGQELRTPLTSITANLTMLVEDASELDDEKQQMLGAIARNTGALQTIVDRLADLVTLESGREPLKSDRLDLAAVAAEATSAIRLPAAERGVRLHTDLPGPVPVDGEARRLRQVLDDLLSNAVQYSPSGSEVRVTLRVDDDQAELVIADSGIGTPPGEQDLIFDRFYRATNVRQQEQPGSGLGLNLARAIVRLHGGTITLTPRHPSGTRVCVCLPLSGSGAETATA